MKRQSLSKGKSKSRSKEKPPTVVKKKPSVKFRRPEGVDIQGALYRKYSGSQNRFYLNITNAILCREQPSSLSINFLMLESFSEPKQVLKNYMTGQTIRCRFQQQIKIFEYHKDIPRIFISQVREIIQKRHHAHRLFEYFRLAKLLGISIEQQSASTFIQSINQPNTRCSYDRVIGEISSYNFSRESQLSENPQKVMIMQIQDLLQQHGFNEKDSDYPQRFTSDKNKKLRQCRNGMLRLH